MSNAVLRDRFYNTGMQLADCLRLLGKHEESRWIERWVLAHMQALKANNTNGRKSK